MALDDIRVSNVDVFGPQVTAQSPTGTVAAPVSSFQVTFNEAIDPATFTAGDVTVTGPAGERGGVGGRRTRLWTAGTTRRSRSTSPGLSRWRGRTRSRWGRTCGTWRATG